MRDEYLALYDEVLVRQPVLFDGVEELLLGLDDRNVPWGIVTNNQDALRSRYWKILVCTAEL